MKQIIPLWLLCLCLVAPAFAQQEPMFTKYMFNSLVFNPAYAGSHDHLSAGILHRTQWTGIQGAPTSQTLTAHTPLRSERVGVGFNLVNDKIGPTSSLGLSLSYAYRINIGKGKLCVGLNGNVTNWRADWTQVKVENGIDDAFREMSPNYWLPNFGAGLYYYTKHFYAGFSCPYLVEYRLRNTNINTAIYARQYRHFYGMIGGAIPLRGDDLILKPSILIKNTGLSSGYNKEQVFKNIGAPNEFDADVSLLFYETFWLGASFRSSFEKFAGNKSSFDSADIWASYFLANGLRIGAAYDYTISDLKGIAGGSFELFLGYEADFKTKKVVTPRYF